VIAARARIKLHQLISQLIKDKVYIYHINTDEVIVKQTSVPQKFLKNNNPLYKKKQIDVIYINVLKDKQYDLCYKRQYDKNERNFKA
jgi:hypothetical protein